MVIIRDFRNPDGPAVRYTPAEWRAFLDRAKRGEYDGVEGDGDPPNFEPSQRVQFDNASLGDFLRGLISEATENDEALRRHLKLFRFARSTILGVIAVALVGSLIFGGGVAAVLAISGLRITAAISIGAGGSATFILTAAIMSRRYLKVALTAFSKVDRLAPKNGSATLGPENQQGTVYQQKLQHVRR